MQKRAVTAYAPASISNLGPAFDVLGLAIDKPGDLAHARRSDTPGLHFSVSSSVAEVPGDAHRNVAAYVASLLIDEVRPRFGIELRLEKKMPIGSGLGSSAASSVAAALAINALMPRPLKRADLLRFAVEGERMASGAPHADNVAPSLLGGAVLVRNYEPLEVTRLSIRNAIVWVVVHPHLMVRTKDARDILPESVLLHAAVRQWGNVAGLIAGLTRGDARLVGACIRDGIVEPVRAELIPGFHRVKEAALRAGAYGCSISGSGPSMFAVAPTPGRARAIAAAMSETFRRVANVACDVYISRVNLRGATLRV